MLDRPGECAVSVAIGEPTENVEYRKTWKQGGEQIPTFADFVIHAAPSARTERIPSR